MESDGDLRRIMSIIENVKKLQEDISRVCDEEGRDRGEITLVAASKYVGADGIREAYDAGIRHFGENRVGDALEKMESLPEDITWHMIGHLQRNKVTKVIGNFAMIQSVDSPRLARKIEGVAGRRDLVQDILMEVNVSGEESKYGLEPDAALSLLEKIVEMPHLNLRGLMTMAPLTEDMELVSRVFGDLARLRDEMEERLGRELPYLSMGMTNDWPVAIARGATHLRIGSAIFKGG